MHKKIVRQAAKQEPNSTDRHTFRRAIVSLSSSTNRQYKLPIPDYAELDLMRLQREDPTDALVWIILSCFFSVSFFFLVPGLPLLSALTSTLDNYCFIMKSLHLYRAPSPALPILSSDGRSNYESAWLCIKYGLSISIVFTLVHFIHTGTLTSSAFPLVTITAAYLACIHTEFTYRRPSSINGIRAAILTDDQRAREEEKYLDKLRRDQKERDAKIKQEGKMAE